MQTFALASGKVRHGMFVVCLFIKSSIILWDENFNTATFKQVIFWQIAKFWLVEFVTMTSAFGNYYTHRQALVKILLMLLRNYCAKIATKKRKHNTNSTEMSVDLVVCVLAVLSLSGAEKGRGQLCWLVQKRTASSSQPSQARPLPSPTPWSTPC